MRTKYLDFGIKITHRGWSTAKLNQAKPNQIKHITLFAVSNWILFLIHFFAWTFCQCCRIHLNEILVEIFIHYFPICIYFWSPSLVVSNRLLEFLKYFSSFLWFLSVLVPLFLFIQFPIFEIISDVPIYLVTPKSLDSFRFLTCFLALYW